LQAARPRPDFGRLFSVTLPGALTQSDYRERLAVLVNLKCIAAVEMDFAEESASPVVEIVSVREYQKSQTAGGRIKLSIALELARKDLDQ
jgi:hypothetical protein